ncbi:MAG: flagellin [Phycisphaerales bacterium]
MTTIPPNPARVPNLLSSQIMLSSITRTNRALLETQIQLATGKRINRPSDDAIGASSVSVIERMLERRDQRIRNLSHAEAVLNTVDHALGDATGIVQEANAIGLSQIGVGSDEATRQSQAAVIDAMLKELFSIGNRQFQDLHLFSGTRTAVSPFAYVHNGIAYRGEGSGLTTDIADGLDLAITLPGDRAFGALSERKQGERDLNPLMNLQTRIADLNGALGEGVRSGAIQIDINGTALEFIISPGETVGDMMSRLEDFLNDESPGSLGPGGISVDSATGNRFNIDVSAGFTITFSDIGSEGPAVDLGLSANAFADGVNETGEDVDPRLTPLSKLSELSGVTFPLGTIRIKNGGQIRDVDLSGLTTIQELQNTVQALGIGVRVEIATSGDRLNFINELSGSDMSVGEVNGGVTVTQLGVRTFSLETRLEDFNDGRGVQIRSGSVDPQTGLPDPAADTDFQVQLKDGRTFDVDLAGAETVEDVITRIEAAATNAGVNVPAEFTVGLAQTGNGFEITDNTAGTTTRITALNGSFAAADLGILTSSDSATFTGEDRATVAVDSLFSHMIALRDALLQNDERGISLATSKLEGDLTRLTDARAEAGVRAQRVDRLSVREGDLRLQDIALKSSIQDLDFAEASIRFANLQTQLQAGLQTTVQNLSLSLLDFLR